MAFTRKQFHRTWRRIQSIKWIRKLHFTKKSHISQSPRSWYPSNGPGVSRHRWRISRSILSSKGGHSKLASAKRLCTFAIDAKFSHFKAGSHLTSGYSSYSMFDGNGVSSKPNSNEDITTKIAHATTTVLSWHVLTILTICNGTWFLSDFRCEWKSVREIVPTLWRDAWS